MKRGEKKKMWTFTVLFILAIRNCQAAEKENSTKIYYAKLSIDNSIIGKMEKIQGSFPTGSNLNIDDLKITTTCETDVKKCECAPGHVWSEDVCRADKSCCGQTSCIFEKSPPPVCISKNTVRITGSLSLDGNKYRACLTKNPPEYENCSKTLLIKMKTVYSTLRGFNNLTIKQFRHGSIIADFEMTIVSGINPENLRKKSFELTKELQARLTLETTGVVQMQIPDKRVPYHAQVNITCKSQKDLGTEPKWHLKNQDGTFNVTNGTLSTITMATTFTKVQLEKVDELWAGEYKCSYIKEKDNITIIHKANATLDICLLPKIKTSTEPDFPHCKSTSQTLTVKAKCSIPKRSSSENYTVVWSGDPIETSVSKDRLEYTAEYFLDCNKPSKNTEAVKCTFKNMCSSHIKSGEVDMKTINVEDNFCKAEGHWKDTKANYIAQLKCPNEDGVITKNCSADGTWEQEVSYCVNQHLNDVLTKALISDIGLGELEKNAAGVFSRFKNVTETKSIASFPNMNTSIEVLSTMKGKLKILITDSVDDFLDSSSHLLNDTLKKSWVAQSSKNNSLLAEKYLSSVEELIQKANMTHNSTKTNLDVQMCKEDKCTNTVFNVSITLQSSDHGTVKTAGFQNLVTHFPYNETEKPNSIVVSTTVEKEKDKARVQIKFSLLNKRPRNVLMTCVAWDNTTHEWSSKGCHWGGPSSEGLCTCSHLSSFTILMSKYPVKLKGLTQITYVGLSISIMSLVISLVIELIVWSDVTKTSTLYLRHIAHVNISLCLLVANCCFLASSEPKVSEVWCRISTVIKHFLYLAMFFWMLCLSTTLLHQAVFLFHKVSKKIYLRYSLVLGYACPLLIVFITFIANQSGAKGSYFSEDSCWLVYKGTLKGSIYTFIIPVGIIVFVNAFSMLVVIMKLLDHHQNREGSQEKEKLAAKAVVRSVILLTPIFGLTWLVGFAVLVLDLASGPLAKILHYAFNLMNTFQGLFILLTTCLGDRMTREALLKRLRRKEPASISESTTKLDSSTLK